MLYLLAFLLPIISYILQIYPRIYNRYFGVDVWTLLIEIDLIRKNRHLIPRGKITNGFLIDGYFDYPPLFLVLLSFLSKDTVFKMQGFISPIFDVFVNITVFFITYQLTNNIFLSLLAQIIYTIMPVTALENSALLPRSMGYALFMFSFYFLLQFTSSGNQNYSMLIIGIILAAITLLTHKFAAQSYLFIAVFFSIFERNIYYIGTLFIAFLLAVILSRGYYIRVIKSHLKIIYFWTKNRKNRFAHQIYGNISVNKNPDLIGIIYKLLIKLAPITLLSMNPWVLSVMFVFLFPIELPLIISKMVLWIIFFYIFGVLVLLIPQLTPIGEGYRYMEMSTLPTAIVTAFIFSYFYNSTYGIYAIILLLFITIGTLSVIIYVQKKAVIKDNNRSLTNNMMMMFKFINELPNVPKIMCIPHQITTMTVYNTKADVLVNFDVEGLFKMSDFYPVLKQPLSKIIKKFNITHLLIRENFAELRDLKLQKPNIIYRSGDIILVTVN